MGRVVHLSGQELLERLEAANFDPAIVQRISDAEFDAAARVRPHEEAFQDLLADDHAFTGPSRYAQFHRAGAMAIGGSYAAALAGSLGAISPLVFGAVIAVSLGYVADRGIRLTRAAQAELNGSHTSPEADRRVARLERQEMQHAEDAAFGREALKTMLAENYDNDQFLSLWAQAGKGVTEEVRVPHIARALADRIEARFAADIDAAPAEDKAAIEQQQQAFRQRTERRFKP